MVHAGHGWDGSKKLSLHAVTMVSLGSGSCNCPYTPSDRKCSTGSLHRTKTGASTQGSSRRVFITCTIYEHVQRKIYDMATAHVPTCVRKAVNRMEGDKFPSSGKTLMESQGLMINTISHICTTFVTVNHVRDVHRMRIKKKSSGRWANLKSVHSSSWCLISSAVWNTLAAVLGSHSLYSLVYGKCVLQLFFGPILKDNAPIFPIVHIFSSSSGYPSKPGRRKENHAWTRQWDARTVLIPDDSVEKHLTKLSQ